MTTLEKLTKHFERFPGIGGRQAKRFAHHILNQTEESAEELSKLILEARSTITNCARCFRFFAKNGGNELCGICSDTSRDPAKLMILEQDSDILSVERSGIYDGYYFVLGGTAPLLQTEDTKKLRGGALKRIVLECQADEMRKLSEIILAFSVNPDGENTSRFVESILKEITEKDGIKISQLGRGLSTGSELEYADPETIKNALQNRH